MEETEETITLVLDPNDLEDCAFLNLSQEQIDQVHRGEAVKVAANVQKVPDNEEEKKVESTPPSSDSSAQKDNSKDLDYSPHSDLESDGDDFVDPPPKRVDGRKKWNGTIRAPLPDEEFATRMHNMHEYKMNGTLPAFKKPAEEYKFRRAAKEYCIDGDRLMKYIAPKGKTPKKVEVVADPQRQFVIMQQLHGGSGQSIESKSLGGHAGINTLQQQLSSRFYWPRITDSAKKFVRSCPKCQQANPRSFQKAKQTLKPVAVPKGIWLQIGIDLMGPLPVSPEGHKYIMTCVDYFSKWVEMFPLKSKSSMEVAQKLYQLMCRFGPARIHITDQGREFVNSISANLAFLTGHEHRITGAYHPQANGLCERQNASTLNALRKSIDEDQHEWYKHLNAIAYSFRATVRKATGKSPFEILFGRPMGLPIDLRQITEAKEKARQDNPDDYCADYTKAEVDEVESALLSEGEVDKEEQQAREDIFASAQKVREELFGEVWENIHKAQEKYKARYDAKHSTGKDLELGSRVMRRNLVHNHRMGGKMDISYMGPYTITGVDAKKSRYTLEDDEGDTLATKVNASNLRPYTDRQEEFPDIVVPPSKPVYKSRAPRSTKEHVAKLVREAKEDVEEDDVIGAVELLRQQGILKALMKEAKLAQKKRKPWDFSHVTDQGSFIRDNFHELVLEEVTASFGPKFKPPPTSVWCHFMELCHSHVGAVINPVLPCQAEETPPDDVQKSKETEYVPEPIHPSLPLGPVDAEMPEFSAQRRERLEKNKKKKCSLEESI